MAKQRNIECWYSKVCTDDCENCLTFLQLDWQMKNSGLPKNKQRIIDLFINDNNRCDSRAFKQLSNIKKSIVEYVETGHNLYICGEHTGNGKTSWAIKLLQSYLHHKANGNYENLVAMYVSTVDLLLRLKDFNNPISAKYREQLETVDLVVWDDIAVTGVSQYDLTQLYSIINNRIFAEKSNIYTSNLTTCEQLEKVLGLRLASRIYGASEIIELKGMDMR